MNTLEDEKSDAMSMVKSGIVSLGTPVDIQYATMVELTKHLIYPKCQYIDCENTLNIIIKILYENSGNQSKDETFSSFNVKYRDTVLKTINSSRNQSVQCMKQIYKSEYLKNI